MDPHPDMALRPGLDWSRIQTVLLDMDGTLLDRHFDDTFFLEIIPKAYADLHRLKMAVARHRVLAAYKQVEGTLEWYDLAYWSRRLDLDFAKLQNEVSHLIRPHPYVMTFLEKITSMGLPVHLVTNAHPWSLQLKLSQTPIGSSLTGIWTSHNLGYPKEHAQFWPRLQEQLRFDPEKTLFADDSEPILEGAAAFGVGQLVHMARPSSAVPPIYSHRFLSVVDFRQILPP
ncbi:MAG: HAD-IA family hydrolase [Magnetococcales bacterium]|nr:HAD-IA family hydrolase [Magnetococcales bacterium]MBF0323003.1 HAD-IA family hydrolase [Magnetococcales bacterium]